MAGYKETPRQKMIAMMYLVLTALLALNVSKEILDAFIVVNESTEATNETFSNKIEGTYTKFEQQLAISPNKVGPFFDQAMEVKAQADKMTNYIDSIKYTVIVHTDAKMLTIEQARNTPLTEIKAIDRYTEPTRFFFGNSDDGSAGEARVLKNNIDEYREQMLSVMGLPSESHRLGLITDGDYHDADGQRQNWEQHNFYYIVLAADVAILSKLITEVKNAEFDVISYLFSSVTAEDFKFDEINAKVIPKSRYIFEGERYEAEIIVAAYDTKQAPSVYYMVGVDTVRNINNARMIEGEKGVVKLDLPAASVGPQRYAGIIQVIDPSGQPQRYSFKDEYVVAKPSLTVSATKMNVFYTGVENPVSISVPGIARDQIIPSISVGTLTRDPAGENFMVRIPGGTTGNATVTVNADFDGSTKMMGSAEFRVKRVPDPTAYVANVNGGNVPVNALIAAGAIIPKMPDDFDFDLNFVITSFTFVSIRSGDIFERRATNNILTDEMKNFVSASKRGTKVWLEDIMARGPDGNRRLGTISLILQ